MFTPQCSSKSHVSRLENKCPCFAHFSLPLSHCCTDDWFGEFARFSCRCSSVYLCFSTHSRLMKGDKKGGFQYAISYAHPSHPPLLISPLYWYPATEYIPPPPHLAPNVIIKKGKNKVYCGMALLLTVSRGCQNPCELLRCGWRSCGWSVESGCSWRPGGSERWARPSPWGPFASP